MKRLLTGFLIFSSLLVGIKTASCEQPVYTFSAQATGGIYSGSMERKSYVGEKGVLSITPFEGFGVSLFGGSETLYRKEPLEKLSLSHAGASFFAISQGEENDYYGITASVMRINGDDSDSDGMGVKYGSIFVGFPVANLCLDAGYTRSPYTSVTVDQLTATLGFTLFHPALYARTRAYMITLGQNVEEHKRTFAIEQKIFLYAIPEVLTFSVSGIFGERIHAYDPDIRTAYTMPDIQEESAGVTMTYKPSSSVSFYLDATAENYKKPSINNSYNVLYLTFGLNLSF